MYDRHIITYKTYCCKLKCIIKYSRKLYPREVQMHVGNKLIKEKKIILVALNQKDMVKLSYTLKLLVYNLLKYIIYCYKNSKIQCTYIQWNPPKYDRSTLFRIGNCPNSIIYSHCSQYQVFYCILKME